MLNRALLLAAVGFCLAGTALPANAQLSPSLNPNQAKPVVPAPKLPSQSNAPPPGLPGAQTSPDLVVPAEKSSADMAPNDALFDAINRGDIAGARDALNRGADVDATNVLGLTPLEQSIDLSRNDITFLLLSLRGTGSASLRPPGAAPPKGSASAARLQADAVAHERRHRGRTPPNVPAEASPAVPDEAAAVLPPAAPGGRAPLFAGNGGTPNPNVGFLGFDQGH